MHPSREHRPESYDDENGSQPVGRTKLGAADGSPKERQHAATSKPAGRRVKIEVVDPESGNRMPGWTLRAGHRIYRTEFDAEAFLLTVWIAEPE